MELNAEAVKRNVKVIRIFIVDSTDTNPEHSISHALLDNMVSYGIQVRIIDKANYKYNMADLRDLLIVDDKVAGLLIQETKGNFHKVRFSIDPETIRSRTENFERLLYTSVPYETTELGQRGIAGTTILQMGSGHILRER
jgi:hypothetical protein